MFKTFFNKVGRAAFTTAQNHTLKQKMYKSSYGITSNTSLLTNIKSTFSTQIIDQQMQSVSMFLRSSPLGNAVALNLMNLRQVLQKCKQQAQLQSSSSTQAQYLVVSGISDSNVLVIIDSCKTLKNPIQNIKNIKKNVIQNVRYVFNQEENYRINL